jgi:carboxylesterase
MTSTGVAQQLKPVQKPSVADGIVDRSTFHQGGRVGFLLIHGLGGTPVELRFVAQGLARAGNTVYCCQLEGHCGTPQQLRDSTWQEWYASVEKAHDALLKTCDVVIVGGLSMGAILALHLAAQRPGKVQGLALFAPTLKLDGWAMPWHIHILHMIRPAKFKLDIYLAEREPYGIKDDRIRNFIINSMQSGDSSSAGVFSTPAHSFAHFNSLVAVVKKELKSIKTPALILHPRNDDIASLKNSLHLQKHLAGMVEMVVLDDSYHIITLDRQRHLVVERTAAFAESIGRRNGVEYADAGRAQRVDN